jgi:protein-S-isoprenylcysteine O-methyltransferase Ste14
VLGFYAPAMFGVLTRAKAVKNRTLSLARLNVELAKLEAKAKATAIGTGAGLAAGAAVLLVYAIGFAFAALAAGLSEAISLWLSLLIVAGILFLAAAIAGFLAVRFVRKASPPTPEQALEEAARTLETFEGHV